MQVIPDTVGTASRSWDDQAQDLTAAATQIGAASTSGFTPEVAQAAAAFVTSWSDLTTTLSQTCETRADGLRTAVRAYLDSDDATAEDLTRLQDYLVEVR